MATKSKIAFLLHQTNTIAHLVLQILSVNQTYQFSRMRNLYMITVYNIIKQNKLKRKRRHMQIRRMLRKPRGFWYERSRTEDWWLKMISDIGRMLRKPRGFWYERSRTEDWWLKMISDIASARSWK